MHCKTAIPVLIALLWLGAAEVRRTQAQSQSPPPESLAFEVASVKPATLGCMGNPRPIGPNSLTTCGSLKHLIMFAYELEDYQVAGGSSWVQSEFYDVQAKAAGISSPRQIRLMLQALLAERFRLKLIREVRPMTGYVLVTEKSGPKLPPAKPGVTPDSPGVVQLGGGEIWSRGATMKTVALALRLELERPVMDQTKIEGNYDFKLRFDEENRELGTPTPEARGSVFTALHEFGLRLDAQKLPIEVLIVESAERPSGN